MLHKEEQIPVKPVKLQYASVIICSNVKQSKSQSAQSRNKHNRGTHHKKCIIQLYIKRHGNQSNQLSNNIPNNYITETNQTD